MFPDLTNAFELEEQGTQETEAGGRNGHRVPGHGFQSEATLSTEPFRATACDPDGDKDLCVR